MRAATGGPKMERLGPLKPKHWRHVTRGYDRAIQRGPPKKEEGGVGGWSPLSRATVECAVQRARGACGARAVEPNRTHRIVEHIQGVATQLDWGTRLALRAKDGQMTASHGHGMRTYTLL